MEYTCDRAGGQTLRTPRGTERVTVRQERERERERKNGDSPENGPNLIIPRAPLPYQNVRFSVSGEDYECLIFTGKARQRSETVRNFP